MAWGFNAFLFEIFFRSIRQRCQRRWHFHATKIVNALMYDLQKVGARIPIGGSVPLWAERFPTNIRTQLIDRSWFDVHKIQNHCQRYKTRGADASFLWARTRTRTKNTNLKIIRIACALHMLGARGETRDVCAACARTKKRETRETKIKTFLTAQRWWPFCMPIHRYSFFTRADPASPLALCINDIVQHNRIHRGFVPSA